MDQWFTEHERLINIQAVYLHKISFKLYFYRSNFILLTSEYRRKRLQRAAFIDT